MCYLLDVSPERLGDGKGVLCILLGNYRQVTNFESRL